MAHDTILTKHDQDDASKLSAQLKGEEKEASRRAESIGKDAGAKVDQAVTDAKQKGKEFQGQFDEYKSDAEKRLDQKSQDVGKQASSAVRTFDKNVTDAAGQVTDSVSKGADKAQSSIWNIFGGGKKE
ncbi:MAG: hypothetical protein Q9162_004597 [Coniocarpon cinnabarinum]